MAATAQKRRGKPAKEKYRENAIALARQEGLIRVVQRSKDSERKHQGKYIAATMRLAEILRSAQNGDPTGKADWLRASGLGAGRRHPPIVRFIRNKTRDIVDATDRAAALAELCHFLDVKIEALNEEVARRVGTSATGDPPPSFNTTGRLSKNRCFIFIECMLQLAKLTEFEYMDYAKPGDRVRKIYEGK